MQNCSAGDEVMLSRVRLEKHNCLDLTTGAKLIYDESDDMEQSKVVACITHIHVHVANQVLSRFDNLQYTYTMYMYMYMYTYTVHVHVANFVLCSFTNILSPVGFNIL